MNLDAKWLRVVQSSGQPLRCQIAGEILDDVIGPMLNRQVVVRGKWSSTDRFRLEDIELDRSAED